MNKHARLIGVLLAMAFVTGCATLLNSSHQTLTFTSAPSGATVLINGQEVGVTPLTFKWERGSAPLSLEFRKEGFEPNFATIQSGMSAAFFGNIITGGLPGTTTDMATGALYEYTPGTYQAVLAPVGEATSQVWKREMELTRFMMLGYSDLIRDLEQGSGEHLDTLLDELGVAAGDRSAAITRLRDLGRTAESIPVFAESVLVEFDLS